MVFGLCRPFPRETIHQLIQGCVLRHPIMRLFQKVFRPKWARRVLDAVEWIVFKS